LIAHITLWRTSEKFKIESDVFTSHYALSQGLRVVEGVNVALNGHVGLGGAR
jgi:hypothetical protein